MSSQIFKETVPKDILIDLLESISCKNNDVYVIDKISYKKAEYHNLLEPFMEKIKPYYFKSKQYYVTRNLTNKTFLTVLRQIAKINNIKYQSNIIYQKSDYDIIYKFYINN
tara:strand:+ start:452 stop:784 length:333 start_codon:yes stop_codon:yes gene_type:complete